MYYKAPARDPEFAPAILELQQQMRDLVLKAARKSGSARLHVHYADNYWTVEVFADGSTKNEGYAEETRGPTGVLEDLNLWELASILEAL